MLLSVGDELLPPAKTLKLSLAAIRRPTLQTETCKFPICQLFISLSTLENKKNDPQVSTLSLSHQQKQKYNFSKLNSIFQFSVVFHFLG